MRNKLAGVLSVVGVLALALPVRADDPVNFTELSTLFATQITGYIWQILPPMLGVITLLLGVGLLVKLVERIGGK